MNNFVYSCHLQAESALNLVTELDTGISCVLLFTVSTRGINISQYQQNLRQRIFSTLKSVSQVVGLRALEKDKGMLSLTRLLLVYL